MEQNRTEDARPPALEVVGMQKSFGGVRALRGVSLSFSRGAVTALLGENGAGKSTLIRLCSGEMQPDQGQLLLDGQPVVFRTPLEAMQAGVMVVHQEPQLVSELTVADNLFLYQLGERAGLTPVSRRNTVIEARALVDRLDLADVMPDVGRLCRDLSAAERQMVDIARALSRSPKVLFLDEPNSSLTAQETDRLFAVVDNLRSRGVAVVLVSHRLSEAYSMADAIVVLRDGQFIGSGSPSEIDQNRAIELMAGDRMAAAVQDVEHAKANIDDERPALEVTRLTGQGFTDVSFAIRPGEIVGMSGLVGAGRTEIALGLIGVTRITSGTIMLHGRPVRISGPRAAQKLGISYVGEERRTEVFADQSVGFNLTARVLERLGRFGLVSMSRQAKLAKELSKRFTVKATNASTIISTLSGGNQQKVLVARALATDPRLLILDEPTRGVDVGTKAEIYRILRDLAHREGLAVWFISSEMDEVIALADRIVVVRNGEITRDAANTADPTPVIAAAMGV